MMAMIPPTLSINGTLGWTVIDLNATTANLNVTRDITTSSGEIVRPVIHHVGSFIESINLATRMATILPFIEPEMDQALQIAQMNLGTSMPTGTDWRSTMSTVDATVMRQPVHTMWWVNGPLKLNDTVPVLVFPTNVTRSTSVDVGASIGSRSAWTLAFPTTRSLIPPDPLAAMTSSIPTADHFEFALTFNYDQTSDLLLSANADIHLGFSTETTIQPSPCNSSATVCPASSPISIMREFGIDVQALLKLTKTTLDLNGRLKPTSVSGSSSSSGPGTSTGNGQGSGAGPGPGSNSGSNSRGSGSNPTSGSTTTGAVQPAKNPAQSKPAVQSANLLPWIYGILGIIAAVIIASGVWIARRRTKKAPSQLSTVQ